MNTRNKICEQEDKDLKKLELENEVKALKRKLVEKDEDLDSSKCKINRLEEELESSRSKINQHDQLVQQLESSRSKINQQDYLVQQLKDKIECPVCLDIPRHGPVPVCPNGHFVCSKCRTDSCPTCRTVMGAGKSLLATTILENIEHNCNFDDCNEKLSLQDLQRHEAVCKNRPVTCPKCNCNVIVPLANLIDHLQNSRKCCIENEAPIKTKTDWNPTHFLIINNDKKNRRWTMHIHAFAGEILGVFPLKSDGHFYFVIVMFASETECSKFNFEMIVHENGKDAVESENTVKFSGSPLSIDVQKEELNLYGISDKLMTKMMKNTARGVSFSFKIMSKENIRD